MTDEGGGDSDPSYGGDAEEVGHARDDVIDKRNFC